MPGEVEVLDLGGLGLPAHSAEDVEVEVHLLRSHPADIEGDGRTVEVGGGLQVIVDDGRGEGEDLEVLLGPPGSRPGEALIEIALERVHGPGGEEDREPTVGDLGCQRHVLGPFGTHDDRDVLAQ